MSPRGLAVLVVDMQNGFVDPLGSIPSVAAPLPRIGEVVEANAALVGEARAAGVPVLYTRHQWRPTYVDAPAQLLDRFPPGATPLAEGTWDAAICDELAPEAGEIVVDKRRFDAFLYTDLELVLRALGATRLLVTGVVTNVCVESTVRSAQMRDFQVAVAADCTTAHEGFHEPALHAMGAVFATVGPWRELLDDELGARRATASL